MIKINIKQYEEQVIYDDPIPYKQLLIYPIKMRDYLKFHVAVNCLMIEKNKIPDPKIISMSYLDFLFNLIKMENEEEQYYSLMLLELFRLCLNIQPDKIKYRTDENGKTELVLSLPYTTEEKIDSVKFLEDVFVDKDKLKKIYDLCPNPIELIIKKQINTFSKISELDIETCQMISDLYEKSTQSKLEYKDFVFDKNDFDDIKKIILHQNIPDYDDTYIDPKVEAALKEAQEFMSRNKKKMGSLEDQLVCILISTSLDMEKIYDLTIRKFSKILERVDYKLHYSIYKQAEMSGMVSFKEEIDHWMCDLKKNKYSDVIVDLGELKGKIDSVT